MEMQAVQDWILAVASSSATVTLTLWHSLCIVIILLFVFAFYQCKSASAAPHVSAARPNTRILLFSARQRSDLEYYQQQFERQMDADHNAKVRIAPNFNVFKMLMWSIFIMWHSLVYNITITNVVIMPNSGRVWIYRFMGSLFWYWTYILRIRTVVVVYAVVPANIVFEAIDAERSLKEYRRRIRYGNSLEVDNYKLYLADINLNPVEPKRNLLTTIFED
jgi:hypothetical protein